MRNILLPALALVLLQFATSCSRKEVRDIESYVVMVSLDGFRWDYPDMYDTPNLDAIAGAGVKADYLLPSFPTKTFPNHYTLATGLYPDHHGIINNSFHAPDLGGIYRIRDRDMVKNPDSYYGEPIWVTAQKQGLRTASFYWVGSEAPIRGIYPTYWKEYDGSVDWGERVDQVLEWLEMPLKKRPALVTLYYDEPDGVGHHDGPESRETGRIIHELDSIVGLLREGIAGLEHADRVNLIVLSDHGMAGISPGRYVNLSDHLMEDWTVRIVGGNPVYLIEPVDGHAEDICTALNALEGVSAWTAEDIPPHLNYGTSSRFPGIVVAADSLWSIGTTPETPRYKATHGYDNAFSQMRTIFYAEGPAFKKACRSPWFANVEVYGILARVLGIEPAETDGDIDNVEHLFAE